MPTGFDPSSVAICAPVAAEAALEPLKYNTPVGEDTPVPPEAAGTGVVVEMAVPGMLEKFVPTKVGADPLLTA